MLSLETSSSTLRYKGAKAWRGLVGQGEGGAHPHSQLGPKHHIATAFVAQTSCHRPCYLCPTLVPHLSPPQMLLSFPIVLFVPLCLMEAVPAIFVNVMLLLLHLQMGVAPTAPPPPFVQPIDSSSLLGVQCTQRPRLRDGATSLAPTRRSKNIAQTGH